MDLYCQRCGEPYDIFSLHDDMTSLEREDFKAGKCCPSCRGKEIEKRPFRAELAAALGDLLGEDLDGLAAEMDDAEYMMGEKFWD